MKPSENRSTRHNPRRRRWLAIGCLIFSLIGFLDAAYITIHHYRGTSLQCSVLARCDEVLGSGYATVGAVPVALLGTVHYLLIFLLTFAYLDTQRPIVLKFIITLTALGFLMSLVLAYLQVFVIQALCLYCLLSALVSVTLFALALPLVRR